MRRNKYTIQEVKNFAIKKNGKCLSDTYINNKTKLEWKCNICSNTWSMSFKPILILGNWCPYCAGRYNNNIHKVRKLAIERGGRCLSAKYKNNKTNLIWQCGKCKHMWEARLDRIKSGTWCPNCRISHGERKIAKYLDSHKIKYKREYKLNYKNMRFDFYLPKYNMAIEYDGVQHFSIYGRYTPNIETLLKRQRFDIDKTLYCVKNSIRFVRIHYSSLNHINNTLDKIFNQSDHLIFTSWSPYNYIIKHLDTKTQFLMLLTGVG